MPRKIISRPEPGFYKIRLVKGSPWAPVLIYQPCPVEPECEHFNWLDRARARPHLDVLIDGQPTRRSLLDLWPWCHPITEAEYRHMRDLAEWARQWAPHEPAANPAAPIDLHHQPSIF